MCVYRKKQKVKILIKFSVLPRKHDQISKDLRGKRMTQRMIILHNVAK